jgi:homoserine acetyltransferase
MIDSPIIFLDIHGVLMNKGSHVPFPYAAEYLKIIVKITNAEIVITSSLRLGKDIDQLQDMMRSLAGKRVASSVMDKLSDNNFDRSEEITIWRKIHGHQGPYVIIDDEPILGHDGHVVQTHPTLGLDMTNADDAAKILLGIKS